ncbi:hypothetical protein WJX77_001611 [Trebouxia sp. C0004]
MLPEVTDLTGTPAPHAAAQPAPQPVARRLVYGPPSAWELSSCFDSDSSPLAMLPEVTDLTGTPALHAAAQLAPQPAPQPVGRQLMYGSPSDWEHSSCSDSDSPPKPEPATKQSAPAQRR